MFLNGLISPNRSVTLVTNLLVLANLALLLVTFTPTAFKSLPDVHRPKRVIATFVGIYSAWAAAVVFVLPAIFRFR